MITLIQNSLQYKNNLKINFAAEKSVINSFSTGSLKGTSSSTNFGTIGYDGGGTITNIYWYDSNSIDSASPSECIQGGSTNCTYLDDTNYTQLFTSTTDIYDTAPAWDGNWVWSGSAYPTLSWE